MALSIRLAAALDWIEKEDKLADIGCDHGYLAEAALKKGVAFVQLIDNKEGPLSTAKKNLAGLDQTNFEFTLASGLTKVEPFINSAAILGMGGELISQILEEGKDKVNNLEKIIIDAHTKIPSLRKYLMDNSFIIEKEKVVKEKGKYYELLLVHKTVDKVFYSEKEIKFGPCLLKEKSPLFIEKWTGIYNEYQEILNKIENKPEKMVEEVKLMEEVLWQK